MNLIFPMAGRGERFGGTFKPFLPLRGEPFIAAAFRPFRNWLARIDRVYFIYLEAQERDFNVRERLADMFSDVPFECVLLPEPTSGPAVTLSEGVRRADIRGVGIVCDCDHAVNVDPVMDRLDRSSPDCLLPLWDLTGENLAAWSVAALDDKQRVLAVAEKRMPDQGSRHAGVIGCYYFADLAAAADLARRFGCQNVSDIVTRLIATGAQVEGVPLVEAEFFGDPSRLEATLRADSRPSTGDRTSAQRDLH